MANVRVSFVKTHPDARLPERKHVNRAITSDESEYINAENERFKEINPEAYNNGYRVGLPFETDDQGNFTDKVLGTGDTGYDVFSVVDIKVPADSSTVVDVGIDLAYISPGFWFMIAPRSGMGFKNGIQPHLGTIDNPYRGNLSVKLYNFSKTDYEVKKGDRIAQLVFYPIVEPDVSWSESKSQTDRGVKGLGSSGS